MMTDEQTDGRTDGRTGTLSDNKQIIVWVTSREKSSVIIVLGMFHSFWCPIHCGTYP